jgi:hypothetical protein
MEDGELGIVDCGRMSVDDSRVLQVSDRRLRIAGGHGSKLPVPGSKYLISNSSF